MVMICWMEQNKSEADLGRWAGETTVTKALLLHNLSIIINEDCVFIRALEIFRCRAL